MSQQVSIDDLLIYLVSVRMWPMLNSNFKDGDHPVCAGVSGSGAAAT
jgi:hypothetical protein